MTNDVTNVPISTYITNKETEELVLKVLRSGQLAQGPLVEELESLSCEMSGAKHAVCVSNGTVSLVSALLAHQIGPGDEVITSPFTFVATLNAILLVGAKAVFADIDAETFCIDPKNIEQKITSRTKAIMPVHIYGQACNMYEVTEIAKKHSLSIIEDSAQAHGATWDGKPVGSFGTGSFSFYATKNVGSGEGGVVTTNDDSVADTLRLIRNQGMRARYEYEMIGWNFRLTDLQAAVAIPQMKDLSRSNNRRREVAKQYNEAFSKIEGLTTPFCDPKAGHVYHQYSILARDSQHRDAILSYLQSKNIGCGIYYPRPVYDYKSFIGNPQVEIENLPVVNEVCERIFSIPVNHYLSDAQVSRVMEEVQNASN